MPAAAKEEMDSLPVFSGGESVLSLAADPQLAENSRQGFETKNAARFQSFELRNSTTALGLRGTLALEGIRKNDSGRYYNPQLQRFISEDPIGFGGGINVYAYVRNNPISRIDPFGLDWLNNLADFSAGAGSVLTVGLTDLINDADRREQCCEQLQRLA